MGERADDVRSNDPQEIHEDIARTREGMSETIDEIQERLSPRRMQEEATERVRSATVGRVEQAGESMRDTGMTMWDTVKQNPLPTALVGIGLGWLYMSRSSQSSSRDTVYDYRPEHGYPRHAGSERYEGSSRDEGTLGRAQELGSEMRERTSHTGHMAQERAQQARSQFESIFQENPLAIGVLAFGAGAMVGLSVPESRKEHELMGEQRDQLIEQARGAAEEKMERAERVAERTIDEARSTAEEEARQQDLTE